MSAPVDLASGLDGRRVKAGSTVWLRGGSYRGPVDSTLTGTPRSPITVRPYGNERAIVVDDRSAATGGTLNVFGAWTTYRDFEVTNSNESRGHQRGFRPMALEVHAPNSKFVNLVIYDTGMGFGFWKEAVDAELYGNVIFNSGTENTRFDSRHGHAVYTQNEVGTKRIRDNIMVNQYGFGIHAYPNPGELNGFRFEGNVVAYSGGANPSPVYSRYNNVLVSGYGRYRADRVEIIENFTYQPHPDNVRGHFTEANVCLGCTDAQTNGSVVLRDNYFAGGAPVAVVAGWAHVTMRGNTLVGMDGMAVVKSPSAAALRSWDWDENTYIGRGPAAKPEVLFSLDGRLVGYTEWVGLTGFDRKSRVQEGRPKGNRTFVRPNEYEPGRATVIVYNWDQAESVEVDLRGVLQTGAEYQVLNAMDYLGAPVLSGKFEGSTVKLPMGALRTAPPRGGRPLSRTNTREFGVFVVKRGPGPKLTEPALAGKPTRTAGTDVPTLPDVRVFLGRFVSRNPRGEVVVESTPTGLRIVILNERGKPAYALTRLSENRFKLEGTPPGFFATFEMAGGTAKSLTIERGRDSPVTLFPE